MNFSSCARTFETFFAATISFSWHYITSLSFFLQGLDNLLAAYWLSRSFTTLISTTACESHHKTSHLMTRLFSWSHITAEQSLERWMILGQLAYIYRIDCAQGLPKLLFKRLICLLIQLQQDGKRSSNLAYSFQNGIWSYTLDKSIFCDLWTHTVRFNKFYSIWVLPKVTIWN